jgi:hypothetical protein
MKRNENKIVGKISSKLVYGIPVMRIRSIGVYHFPCMRLRLPFTAWSTCGRVFQYQISCAAYPSVLLPIVQYVPLSLEATLSSLVVYNFIELCDASVVNEISLLQFILLTYLRTKTRTKNLRAGQLSVTFTE